MMLSLLLALGTGLAHCPLASAEICSPEQCIKGTSSAGLLTSDPLTSTHLLPGLHAPSSPYLSSRPLIASHSSNALQLVIPSYGPAALGRGRVNVSLTPAGLYVPAPHLPVAFGGKVYRGQAYAWGEGSGGAGAGAGAGADNHGGDGDRDANPTGWLADAGRWTADGWDSLYLPDGWYALDKNGVALWGAIPDAKQLPGGVERAIRKSAMATCSPPCASNGICVPATFISAAAAAAAAAGVHGSGSETIGAGGSGSGMGSPGDFGGLQVAFGGRCACAPGWAGAQCDVCARGHYGPQCIPCERPGGCTACDDGLAGTGVCVGTRGDASSCACAHGTCRADGTCACAAGYATSNSTTTSTDPAAQCNVCIPGYYQTANGDCTACPQGCASCRLREGTVASAVCTSCRGGLRLDTALETRCAPRAQCAVGQYWDDEAGQCAACSPACASCVGPAASQCLVCAPPRMALAGACVGVDARGVCESASSRTGLQGVFVGNNEKGACDACPAGCASCHIPSFSPVAPFASLRCDACADGYLMQDGRCVKRCGPGWFVGNAERNGTCTRCSGDCTECIGSATHCTRCASPSFAIGGSCAPSCPSGTISAGGNGTCTTCHPDCATCSGPSASSCTTCPAHRPVLLAGRCAEYCPKSSYIDASAHASATCKACDSSCASCAGAGDSRCTSCAGGYVLSSGACVRATCDGGGGGGVEGYARGLGVCMEELVDPAERRWLWFIVLPVVLVLGGLGWWFVRKQRKGTEGERRRWRRGMDEWDVRRRVEGMKWGRLAGMRRVPEEEEIAGQTHSLGEGLGQGRNRLKELWLSSRPRAGAGALGRETGSTRVKGSKGDVEMDVLGEEGDGGGLVKWSWGAPPPPYAPSSPSDAGAASGSGSGSVGMSGFDIKSRPAQDRGSVASTHLSPTYFTALREMMRAKEGAGGVGGAGAEWADSSAADTSGVNSSAETETRMGSVRGREREREMEMAEERRRALIGAVRRMAADGDGDGYEERLGNGWEYEYDASLMAGAHASEHAEGPSGSDGGRGSVMPPPPPRARIEVGKEEKEAEREKRTLRFGGADTAGLGVDEVDMLGLGPSSSSSSSQSPSRRQSEAQDKGRASCGGEMERRYEMRLSALWPDLRAAGAERRSEGWV